MALRPIIRSSLRRTGGFGLITRGYLNFLKRNTASVLPLGKRDLSLPHRQPWPHAPAICGSLVRYHSSVASPRDDAARESEEEEEDFSLLANVKPPNAFAVVLIGGRQYKVGRHTPLLVCIVLIIAGRYRVET